jgi:hypothetical protein
MRNRHPGLYYITYNKKYGTYYSRPWPPKRPKLNPKTKAQNDEFRQVMKLVRYSCGEDRVAAGDYVAGKPFLPQDALVAATMGTLYSTITVNGVQQRSARIMSTQIQSMLDSIASIPGSMLVRTATDWEVILPGANGDVLTFDTTSGVPDWAPGSGGGGIVGDGLAWPQGQSGQQLLGAASWGTLITPLAASSVLKIGVRNTFVAGATYVAGIAPFDVSTGEMTAAPTLSPPVTITDASIGVQHFELASAYDLVPGTPVLVWCSRTDGDGSTSSTVYQGDGGLMDGLNYIGVTNGGWYILNNAPSMSDTWTVYYGAVFTIGIGYAPA